MARSHPTTDLLYPIAKTTVPIDVKIVPLMKVIWAYGWRTFNSCQDNNRRVWIEFSYPDAEAFLSVVAQHASSPVALAVMLAHRRNPEDTEMADTWDLSHLANPVKGRKLLELADIRLRDLDNGLRPDAIKITVSIRFPKKHLNEVVNVLERALAERSKASKV